MPDFRMVTIDGTELYKKVKIDSIGALAETVIEGVTYVIVEVGKPSETADLPTLVVRQEERAGYGQTG